MGVVRIAARTAGLGWPALALPIVIGIVLVEDPLWTHLATLIAIWTLWGTSLNLIWGYAGQFSMSQSALGALAAYLAGILIGHYQVAVYAGLLIALLAAVAASAILGLIALRLRGFYFAIMTLAFLLVLLAVLENSALAGRTTGLPIAYHLGDITVGPLEWNLDSRHGGFLIVCGVLVMLALFMTRRLLNVRLGRAMLAVRDDPLLAMSFGIDPSAYKIVAFMLSAVVAGVAGVLLSLYLHYITPEFYAFDTLITMIVMLVIGGTARLLGPLVGAIVYVMLVDGFRIGGDYRQAVFGLALILIVIFAPQGLVGLAAGAVRRTGRTRAARQPSPEAIRS
jgi:ABC-type branched-subunit amino acid transport system permease subunit